MIERACMTHGLPLDDDLHCAHGHTCESWDVLKDGQVIGRANQNAAVLFCGIAEEPDPVSLDELSLERPDYRCRRKGHWAWRFKADRGVGGGWICGTCADSNRRQYEARLRRERGLNSPQSLAQIED